MKYTINIGKIYDINEKKHFPKMSFVITKEEFEIIKMFADVEMDAELKPHYKLNKCVFTVIPIIDLSEIENYINK